MAATAQRISPGPRVRNLLRIARDAMACEFAVHIPAGDLSAVGKGAAALDEVDRLESVLSAYRDDSGLSQMNRTAAEQPVVVEPELFEFVEAALRMSVATAGAFDCTTGSLIRAWGFFRGPQRVPQPGELAAALAASGYRRVQLDPQNRSIRFLNRGTEINPGAIGKGFAIDRALKRIESEHGRRSLLMQGGKSSVRAVGCAPGDPAGWPVGIGDPFRAGRALALIHLRDRALGTSAADRQFFTAGACRYGHILDPRSGRPADTVASATALAATATAADALSTAFFVLGVDGTREFCRRHPEVGAIVVTKPEADRPPRIHTFGLAREEVRFL